MTHEPRLTLALRHLLWSQRVAALGTLGADGLPFVSMVPYAIDPHTASIVIHVSALAAHTRNMQSQPRVSLMVMQAEQPQAPVHALPRVTLEAHCQPLAAGSDVALAAKAVYLQRFPDAEPMTELGDFMFVSIVPSAARQVAGFGAARSVDADTLKQVLSAQPAE